MTKTLNKINGKRALIFSYFPACLAWRHLSARLKEKGMCNSILVQGYKCLSLIKNCSKTYLATHDENFTGYF